ncbi:dimethyl sulfoxide reductase anchor subunit [Rubripirellula amarantea]|uniref:Anaerobic dimethyl sulfoxide reductase chain B n=1 Tax=Rubripirellula amarantea TaxID=2527999 RepID=A0A5C5WR78_9BACT|nr:DmsC/YnfH family molybdoenzyme membrane anchor subunit [Rubripirellula amarantea]MDA8744588.1 dimethyl sulfoxide reductase anchor subunit [Rubripirellula amarantea]TWT53047.1 Anaerobic dimethyl sulfoxide reductase chain B [Rubripirellula amarantea]
MSSTLPFTESKFDIVDELLRQQQSLSAVEQFSALHDADDSVIAPAQEQYYRRLLPATPPSADQQFAFEVDLDQCSGCKACVVACHTLNGLDEDESWRRVGTITIGEVLPAQTPLEKLSSNGSLTNESSPSLSLPTVGHVTTACHHCEDPGCLNGCPVRAYEKDPLTGIVRHLDDQCIGCKYCMMMCPYEVPQYSERLGIVRKCDMCHQRLSVGEAPACVQACPNEAIAIKLVDRGAVFDDGQRLAPDAPLSEITKPSTRYKSVRREAVAAAVPQDRGVDEVAESHWPLAVMLVATQISVGIILVERTLSLGWVMAGAGTSERLTQVSALVALLIGGIGLNVAPLHLGRPLRAWRIFLGLRTSWLSREAVILGKYMGLLGAATVLLWMPAFADYVPESISTWIPDWAGKAALGLSIVTGIVGLYCSAMIYIATNRELWRSGRTLGRFFATGLVAGLTLVAAMASFLGSGTSGAVLGLAAVGVVIVKIIWEWQIHLGAIERCNDKDRRSADLIKGHMKPLRNGRIISAAVGGFVVLLASVISPVSPLIAGSMLLIGAASLMSGEMLERLLYFKSVVYDRMPGTF